MVRAHVCLALAPDIAALLDTYGKEGGNKSGLVNSLLLGYFKGDIGKNGHSAKVALMQKRIDDLSLELLSVRSALGEASALFHEEKEKESEKNGAFKQKIEDWFEVNRFGSEEAWITNERRDGGNPQQTIKKGIVTLAEKNGLSLPIAYMLLKEVYPLLWGLIND